jgi:hypothetical protein
LPKLLLAVTPTPELVEAEARATRNGMMLEYGDVDLATSWRGMRMVSVHLMRGREQVASAAMSYHDDAGKERALRFCLGRVYSRPIGAG